MRLERQINALRRDAYGLAKMVTYVEKVRAKTAGTGSRTAQRFRGDVDRYVRHEDDAFSDGVSHLQVNPYTGEYVADDDESSAQDGDRGQGNVGIQGDPQGLNRIPGIGTGAAKRIVTSYEMEHPYVDITVHALSKSNPTPEAMLYNTGFFAGGFKDTYAISTSASDRMTDRVDKAKKKVGLAKPHNASMVTGVRPISTGSTAVRALSPAVTADPDAVMGINNLISRSLGHGRPMSLAERALRDSSPPRIPSPLHGRPKTGETVAGNAVNVVRSTRHGK